MAGRAEAITERSAILPSWADELPSEWGWCRLADVCLDIVDCPHSTPELVEGGPYLMARTSDILTGVFRADQARRVSERTYRERTRRVQPKYGDLLYSREGTYFGLAAEVPAETKVCLGQRMVLLRPDAEQVHPVYLRYWLNSSRIQSHIQGHRDGSVAERLNLPTIRHLPVCTPSMREQRAIAHILGTLDDKIELNRRMNETLQAIAWALFKSWFVDFDPVRAKAQGRDPGLPKPLADLFPDSFEDSELEETPKGWQVGPLGGFFTVGLGGTWGDDQPSPKASVAVRCLRGIDCHDLAEGRVPDVPSRWLSSNQTADRQLVDGTLLIEGSGSFCGRSLLWHPAYGELIGEPVAYSNFCKRLNPACTPSQAVVCWLQMRGAYRDGELQVFRTGTAFPNFDVHGALANLYVLVPPADLADVFARLFRLGQRLDLMAQGRTLAALRDTLLPKLISGELRIKDPERIVRVTVVPEISRFFGIIVTMNYNDHAPPHFHARYGGDQAILEIQTLQVLGGRLGPRVMGLVIEWALQHRDELLEDWRLARESAPLNRIAPLE